MNIIFGFVLVFLISIFTFASNSPCFTNEWSKHAPDIKSLGHLKFLGRFSKLEHTDRDHAYGYTIEILKNNNNCQALILDYNGLLEPYYYALSNEFNCPKPGKKFKFSTSKAHMLAFMEIGPKEYSAEFKGKIKKNSLIGKIRFHKLNTLGKPEKEKLQLKPLESKGYYLHSSVENIRKIKGRNTCLEKY